MDLFSCVLISLNFFCDYNVKKKKEKRTSSFYQREEKICAQGKDKNYTCGQHYESGLQDGYKQTYYTMPKNKDTCYQQQNWARIYIAITQVCDTTDKIAKVCTKIRIQNIFIPIQKVYNLLLPTKNKSKL